jgi:hypothetical protein
VLVLYYLSTTPKFSAVKLSISTGAWVSELTFSLYNGATTSAFTAVHNFGLFRSQLNSAVGRNYIFFTADDSGPTYRPAGFYRINDNLDVDWSRTIGKTSSIFATSHGGAYIQDMDYNSAYSIALGYHDLGTAANADLIKIMLFNETTGETL